MTYNKTDVTLELRINRHIMAALQALADRDPGVDVGIIVRRSIMRELGLDQPAINLWEAEERQSRAIKISQGAAALIRKAIELTPEEIAELDELKKEYVDELQDFMRQFDKNYRVTIGTEESD